MNEIMLDCVQDFISAVVKVFCVREDILTEILDKIEKELYFLPSNDVIKKAQVIIGIFSNKLMPFIHKIKQDYSQEFKEIEDDLGKVIGDGKV